ncbi:MAG: hypothetical protein GC180_06440 [Bacteroidetes bacterium]|nr:hypothetical protein [Bacteroidota bacterium]
MNKKVLLLVKDLNKLNEQIDALLHFFSVHDKLILAVFQEDSEGDWPFRMYDLGWPVLQEENLIRKLQHSGSLKKRSRAKWMESSSFLDMVVIHKNLLDAFRGQEEFENILEEIHCPIFLMDENQTQFDEIFFSYNGTGASFNSIKHFTYLFHPHFNNSLLNLVVKVNDKALNLENCVYGYIRLHKRHFAISRLFEEDYDSGIERLLDQSHNPLVICGGERKANLHQFLHYSDHRLEPSSMFLV